MRPTTVSDWLSRHAELVAGLKGLYIEEASNRKQIIALNERQAKIAEECKDIAPFVRTPVRICDSGGHIIQSMMVCHEKTTAGRIYLRDVVSGVFERNTYMFDRFTGQGVSRGYTSNSIHPDDLPPLQKPT